MCQSLLLKLVLQWKILNDLKCYLMIVNFLILYISKNVPLNVVKIYISMLQGLICGYGSS